MMPSTMFITSPIWLFMNCSASQPAIPWSGLFLPKGTPAAIMSKLNRAASEAMDRTAAQDRMHELGATLVSADRRSPRILADARRTGDREVGPTHQGGRHLCGLDHQHLCGLITSI